MAGKQFTAALFAACSFSTSPLGATDSLLDLSRRADCDVCIQQDVYFLDAHTRLTHVRQSITVTSKAAAKQLRRFSGTVRSDGWGQLFQRLGVRTRDGRIHWQDTAVLAAYSQCLTDDDANARRSSSERKQCALEHAIKLELEIGDTVLAEFVEQEAPRAFVDVSVALPGNTYNEYGKSAASAPADRVPADTRVARLYLVHVPNTVNVQTDGNVELTVTQHANGQTFSVRLDGDKTKAHTAPKWFVISTGKNWQQLADAYLAANDISEDVGHPRVQALARDLGLTREDEPPLVKLERLRQWFNAHIKHINSVGFVDFNNLRSEPAATIIEQGYTDCKGYERLTRALLTLAGINSSPAHLRNRPEPVGHSAHVPGWQFNHVVSYIADADLYVDFSGRPQTLFRSALNDQPYVVLRSDTGRLHALHDRDFVSLKRLKADLRKLGIEPAPKAK